MGFFHLFYSASKSYILSPHTAIGANHPLRRLLVLSDFKKGQWIKS